MSEAPCQFCGKVGCARVAHAPIGHSAAPKLNKHGRPVGMGKGPGNTFHERKRARIWKGYLEWCARYGERERAEAERRPRITHRIWAAFGEFWRRL